MRDYDQWTQYRSPKSVIVPGAWLGHVPMLWPEWCGYEAARLRATTGKPYSVKADVSGHVAVVLL